MLTSNALVVFPLGTREIATQVVIAQSDPVLAGRAARHPPGDVARYAAQPLKVKSLTGNVLSISAQGRTAAQAESTANAVANSLISYSTTR